MPDDPVRRLRSLPAALVFSAFTGDNEMYPRRQTGNNGAYVILDAGHCNHYCNTVKRHGFQGCVCFRRCGIVLRICPPCFRLSVSFYGASLANWKLLSQHCGGVLVRSCWSQHAVYFNALSDLGIQHALSKPAIELLDIHLYVPNDSPDVNVYRETWAIYGSADQSI